MINKLSLVREFGSRPYGRYPQDGELCGENFRKQLLAPRLRKAIGENEVLYVDLDGYNRYGRSFLDEAFGGLIREENFTAEEVTKNLQYKHSLVKSIEEIIKERIDASISSLDE
ncbi:conserved hypothetical protein [Alteromonas infernus]